MADTEDAEEKDDISQAKERYELAKNGWSEVYEDARDDQLFYGGEQWAKADVDSRIGRPTLTTSHLQQFVHQVANEMRLNTPTIKVLPIDDGADIEGAKMRQGLVRSIETVSSADIAYDTGGENAIISSFGFIRVDHDYVAPDKFEQHILIKPCPNPLAVYIDPNSMLPDGSDAQYGFVLDTITKKQFKRLYPKFEPSSFGGGKEADDSVTIAEYFCIRPTQIEIALLPDGKVMELEQAEALGLQPVKTRFIEKNKVYRQKLSDEDVLEETTFPGSYIPIVPVYGEVRWIDGKRHIWSLIRNAKDAQRMINYYSSMEIESLSKAPQAPFEGPAGSFANHEEDWRNPQASMVLQWTPVYDASGNLLPKPSRLQPPQIPTGAVNAKRDAIEEMKSAMGLFNANLGAPSNETSGLAIQKRQKQGEIATAHFGDNLNKSIQHVGRICLSMMPEIYDTTRIIRVLGEEDEASSVAINDGGLYDINAGRYDVAITSGPGFVTRRQEGQDMMALIMQTNPQLVNVMGDLFFKYSDVPGADVISARLKKTIPPQLLGDEEAKKEGQRPIDPEKEQMGHILVEQKQQLQQMGAELQDKTFEQQIKAGELKIKEMETQIKAGELKIKEADLQIKAFTAQMSAMNECATNGAQSEKPSTESEPQQPTQPMPTLDTGDSIEVLHLKLQQKIAEKQTAQEQSQIQAAELQQAREQQALQSQIQLAQDAADKDEARARSDALLQNLSGIQQALGAMIQSIQQPKQVVRDENNMIIGVK